MKKFCRFEMEQQLIDCWDVTKDLQSVFEEIVDHDMKREDIANVLLGMQELYNLKFEKLWRSFEQGIQCKRIQ